ncbi:MAG: NUDIX hydrolase [Patescibacteria group bacterium]
MSWKRLDRKTLIDTKFLKVYEDKVKLPNGNVIDDYSVIEKPNYSMIVALDTDNNIVTIDEYKYAINKIIHTLPAGHIEKGEDPLESAKRELAEETGYTGGEWENLGEYYDYTTKDSHRAHFIKATGVTKTQETNFDPNESLTQRVITVSELKKEIARGEWRANATLAALVAAKLLS